MLKYALAILGLAMLTALWMVFQLWLKRQDPDLGDRCVGCASNCKRREDRADQAQVSPESGME